MIGLLNTIIALIKAIFDLWRKKTEEQRSMLAELTAGFRESSKNLCLCLASGGESIKTIHQSLANPDTSYMMVSQYELLRDCSKMVSQFNNTRLNFLNVLEPLERIKNNHQEYERYRGYLDQLLDEYAYDLQDTSYITRLVLGAETSLSDDNSELLRNIVSLYKCPQDSIRDIISLRFRSDGLRDYYTDLQNICNKIAEILNIPVRSDYSIVILPFRAGLGNPGQMYRLGVIYLQQNNRTAAGYWLEKAIEKGHLDAHLVLGKVLLKEGKIDSGLMLLHNASDQNHEESILELGRYYSKTNKTDKAIECFSRLSTRRRDAKFYLARCYESKRDTHNSIVLFAELVGEQGTYLDIFSAAAMYHIVEAHFSSRIPKPNFEAILGFYDRIENKLYGEDILSGDYLQTLIPLQKAKLFRFMGQRDRALEILNKLVVSNSAIAQCELGWAYYFGDKLYERDKQLALEYFSLSANQHYPEAYVGKGLSMLFSGHSIYDSDAKIALNYLKTAAKYDVHIAAIELTVLYYVRLTARIGEGEKEDGVKYEQMCHAGIHPYYYVSVLDDRIYISRIIENYMDIGQYGLDHSLLWWMSDEDTPSQDLLKQSTNKDMKTIWAGSYGALDPFPSPVNLAGCKSVLITLAHGHIRVKIYATNGLTKNYLDSKGEKYPSITIEIKEEDKIKSILIDCSLQDYEIESLMSETEFLTESSYKCIRNYMAIL